MCDIITITHVFGCDSCHHFACATSVDKLAVYFVVSYVCVDELVSPDNHCTVQTQCRPVYILEHSCWYPVQSSTGCDKTSSPNENNKLKSWSSSLAKGGRRRRHHHRHHYYYHHQCTFSIAMTIYTRHRHVKPKPYPAAKQAYTTTD